jgi:hypothetical protein
MSRLGSSDGHEVLSKCSAYLPNFTLAGWLDQYFKKYAGRNELQYRRLVFSSRYKLNPSDLRRLMCAAVVLERKEGEVLFHYHVLALLTKSISSSSSEGGDQQHDRQSQSDRQALVLRLGKACH